MANYWLGVGKHGHIMQVTVIWGIQCIVGIDSNFGTRVSEKTQRQTAWANSVCLSQLVQCVRRSSQHEHHYYAGEPVPICFRSPL